MTDIKRVIAYSTMSQIGYMIMGVSVGAYSAGLFHLMTHAFFKALLFMAAGSIIGAMAGDQSLDRMGGFRKALPFTFVCFISAAWRCAGMPPFSGWLSKDDIIAFLDHRGGGFVILGIVGYLGALMTGIYTFRMIFRAFFGDPCAEARELEHGHLAPRRRPAQPDDRRGGGHRRRLPRPRPLHRRARVADEVRDERRSPCSRSIGGVVQIPGVDDAVTKFLEPTFADSKYAARRGAAPVRRWLGLVIGALIASRRHLDRVPRSGSPRPAPRAAARAVLVRCYVFLSNKWYFDELIDFADRPARAVDRPASSTPSSSAADRRRATGGTDGRGPRRSAAVRRAQTGFLRYYAALMIVVPGRRRPLLPGLEHQLIATSRSRRI